MASALSLFVKEKRLIVVEDFELPEIKTKKLVEILGKLGASSALLVDFGENDNLRRSASNLAKHRFLPPEGVNVYDILKHDQIVVSKRAIEQIQEKLEGAVRPRRAEK